MREKLKDSVFKIWIGLSTSLVFIVVVYIFLYIFINGAGSINGEFLFSAPKGMPIGSEGGIFPAIVGSCKRQVLFLKFRKIIFPNNFQFLIL